MLLLARRKKRSYLCGTPVGGLQDQDDIHAPRLALHKSHGYHQISGDEGYIGRLGENNVPKASKVISFRDDMKGARISSG
jgi:hypothetical protein